MAISFRNFQQPTAQPQVAPQPSMLILPTTTAQPKAEAKSSEVRLLVTVAASAAKGGTLRQSHGDELRRSVLVCTITKVLSGSIATFDDEDNRIDWERDEVKDGTVVLALDDSDIPALEQEFNSPKYLGRNGGRAMAFEVTCGNFSMGNTGNFYTQALELANFQNPVTTAPSAAEQKRLAAEKQQANRGIRMDRINAARQNRTGGGNLSMPTSESVAPSNEALPSPSDVVI